MADKNSAKFRRPSFDENFVEMLPVISKRSTCFRHQIGAIVVKDNKIVSSGYNGNPRTFPHCDEMGCIRDELGIKSGTQMETCTGVHAEQNALLQAGKMADGATLYCNAFPCRICARLIINAKITRVVIPKSANYADKDGMRLLKSAGIKLTNERGEGEWANLKDIKEIDWRKEKI
jgi:dCMP deaminase